MPTIPPGSRWRRCRLVFRWCRVAAFGFVLLLLLLAVYLNRSGVPEPVKALVTGALLDRGLTVEFDRLRLHWYRGLVAEGVKGRRAGQATAPHLEFKEVTVNLQWSALLGRRVEIRALGFHEGRLTAPVQATNALPEEAVLDVAEARLEFGADDTWSLEEFTAQFEGLTLNARGFVGHGSALPLQVKSAFRPGTPRSIPGSIWRAHVRTLKHQLSRLRFSEPPQVHFTFRGDGRDFASFRNELRFTGGGAWTPWGEVRQFNLLARARPLEPGRARQQIELRLGADGAATPWGSLRNAHLEAVIVQPFTNTLPERIQWNLQADELSAARLAFREARLQATSIRSTGLQADCRTDFELVVAGVECPWGTCGESRLRGQANHTLTNAVPDQITGHLEVGSLTSGSRGLAGAEAELHVRRVPVPADSQDPGLAYWRDLAPWEAEVNLRARGVETPELRLDSLAVDAHWAFPTLSVTNLVASLYDGRVSVREAAVDVRTRETTVRLTTDLDIQRLDGALPPGAQRWLAQFKYDTPPHAEASVRVVVPPWTGGGGDAARELRTSLELVARLDGQDVVFNGLPASRAGVTITISNEVLRLRDLAVIRPEGRAELSYDLDLARRDFRWRVQSQVDAQTAAPAVDPVLPGIVRLFSFPTPPQVSGEIWGNWKPPKVVNLELQLAATNFTFRGEPFVSLDGRLLKNGSQLTATNVRVQHVTGWVEAPQVGYDIPERLVTLSNVGSGMDPLVAARCIGPALEETLKPFRFATPPVVEANGHVQAGSPIAGSDLVFAVHGGPFQYWRFNTRNVAAVVRWTGERVGVTNVACEFYGGRLSGEFILNLPEGREPQFDFQARGTDFDLQGLLRDTVQITNRIAGTVTGTIVVTNAFVSDWTSWHGYGQARMRDGTLWDLPIFGVLSKVMNLVAPGTGNSRATAAQGHYTITRSVIRTDDLQIDAGPARLQYAGTVDFQGNVEARVMAEVLRATPLIGPFISLVFSPASKALEFKVTGTLGAPVLKPVYVPQFLLPLFNPLGTVQGLFNPKSATPEAGPK